MNLRRRQDLSIERKLKKKYAKLDDSSSTNNSSSSYLVQPNASDTGGAGDGYGGNENHDSEKSNLNGDRANIALLLFLYLLQGIPLGLTSAIPMLLQNRGASYKQQAEFSFAYWPFSLKLLWAPIVDSVYCNWFGRRKSWMIPTQYLIGIFMMLLSNYVDQWLGGSDSNNNVETIPNVPFLTTIFFALNFLAATQDIAVDGWALTILKRCNVGHASTCNSVGQTAGYFLGYVVFIALESKEFCNTYLRVIPQNDGLITLPQFLWFWGICFLVTTTLVGLLKHENTNNSSNSNILLDDKTRFTEHPELNIQESYQMLFDIIKMRPIQILSVILLTVKITFAASDSVSSLKLIDAGVPKEKLALLAIPMIPLQIILPLIISRYTNGPKPMKLYIQAIPYRIFFAITAVIIVYLTPIIINNNNGIVPYYYYIILIVNYAFYQIFLYCMFVAIMAFFAKISDPAVGGTYMTFLNTVCNLGGNWPTTVVLWLVDVLTWRHCQYPLNNLNATSPDIPITTRNDSNYCVIKAEQEECELSGGKCEIIIDGYYIECLISFIYGGIWLIMVQKWIKYLQNLPTKQWLVTKPQTQYKKQHKSR